MLALWKILCKNPASPLRTNTILAVEKVFIWQTVLDLIQPGAMITMKNRFSSFTLSAYRIDLIKYRYILFPSKVVLIICLYLHRNVWRWFPGPCSYWDGLPAQLHIPGSGDGRPLEHRANRGDHLSLDNWTSLTEAFLDSMGFYRSFLPITPKNA